MSQCRQLEYVSSARNAVPAYKQKCSMFEILRVSDSVSDKVKGIFLYDKQQSVILILDLVKYDFFQ